HLTNLTVRAEFRGQAGDAVRAVDPDPREREQAVSRRGGPEALDRRTEKPGRTDGGEDARVVAAGRITEEIDRNVETPPDPPPRAGDLVPEGRGPERGQVEVIDRVRIDLPALANHELDLPDRQLAVQQVADGEVEDAGPVALREQRPNVRKVFAIAVVEGEDDGPRRQRVAAPPVVVDAMEGDCVEAVGA